jgi:Amt family ammonium transporter
MSETPAYSEVFGSCADENSSDRDVLECVVAGLSVEATADGGTHEYARSIFLVYAAALVFFMQAGFAMLCAGAVRKKNVQNTMLKNLLDACGASLAFFTVGYAFAFGRSGDDPDKKTFIGTSNFFLMDVEDYAFWLFQYAFSAASATIVAGTLAERCQMAAYLCYSVMLTGWVYPIIAHSVWSQQGWISAYAADPLWGVGMVDFAGSGVVHVTGGITALFATMILGPRRGRFHDDSGRRLDRPRDFPGSSVALQMLGTFVLWFGWYGFNGGSALLSKNPDAQDIVSLAAVNTTLSAGTAGIVALMFNLWLLERYTGEPYFDLKYAMNGCLSGLVSITAGCGVMEPWAAVVIGTVAGLLYIGGSKLLLVLRLDDAVDAIPVHMVNGMWGVIAVGLFASRTRLENFYGFSEHPGLFYSWSEGNSDAVLLGTQLVGLLFICGWVMVIMLPFFVWLDWRGWFRSDPLEEIVGLDTSYHGGLALLTGEGDDAVNPEYISAYKQQKTEKTNRKKRRQSHEEQHLDTFVGSSHGERSSPEEEEQDDFDEPEDYSG